MAAAAVFNPSASTESEEWFDANAAPAPGTAGAVVFAAGGPQRSSPSGEQGASGQHSPDPTGVTPVAAPLTPAAVATESPVGSRAPHARSPVPGGVSPAANPVPAPGASELLWRPLPPSVLDWVCFSTLSDSLFQPRRELVSEYRMRAGAGARAGDRHNTSSRIGLQHSLRPRRSKDFIAENIRACSSGSGSQPRPGAGPHSPDRSAMSLSGVFDGDGAPPADAPTAAATQESPRGKSPRARASTVQSPTRLLYLTARSPPGAAPVSPSPRAHRHHSGRSGTALSPSDSLSPFPSHFLAPPAPPADLRAPFVAGLRQLLHECACSLKEVRFSWFTRFRRRVASPPCVVYLAHAVCVVLSVHPRVEPVEEPSNTEGSCVPLPLPPPLPLRSSEQRCLCLPAQRRCTCCVTRN